MPTRGPENCDSTVHNLQHLCPFVCLLHSVLFSYGPTRLKELKSYYEFEELEMKGHPPTRIHVPKGQRYQFCLCSSGSRVSVGNVSKDCNETAYTSELKFTVYTVNRGFINLIQPDISNGTRQIADVFWYCG